MTTRTVRGTTTVGAVTMTTRTVRGTTTVATAMTMSRATTTATKVAESGVIAATATIATTTAITATPIRNTKGTARVKDTKAETRSLEGHNERPRERRVHGAVSHPVRCMHFPLRMQRIVTDRYLPPDHAAFVAAEPPTGRLIVIAPTRAACET